MKFELRATYTDVDGTEEKTIFADNGSMRMTLRGVEFKCYGHESWEPVQPPAAAFQLRGNELSEYVLSYHVPLTIETTAGIEIGTLRVTEDWRTITEQHTKRFAGVSLTLTLAGREVCVSASPAAVIDKLQELQLALDASQKIKACASCAYSDYHPFGPLTFGLLACFRNTKAEYLAGQGKWAYMQVESKMAGHVHEAHVCEEYAQRTAGTGFREFRFEP